MAMLPGADAVEAFRNRIFAFYASSGRSFPWRETTDRYAVMVSEVMLQQTQAERVVAKYLGWLDRFPDVRALAAAPLRDVLALWNGLGYNSRAQRLHNCSRIIVERFASVVPHDPQLLRTLPGIGAYACRSIPVFADNLDVAAVDTNIRRILIHEFSLPETILPRFLQGVADAVLPTGRSRDWHNALMDYGALELTGRRTGIRPMSRQSVFKGSKRWYRGRILKGLIEDGVCYLDDLELHYPDCCWDLGEIVLGMVGEGLLESTLDSHGRPVRITIKEC